MSGYHYRPTERIRRLLCNELWNVGLIEQTAADIAREGVKRPVRWFPAPDPGTMLADPSYRVRDDGGCALFAEFLDYRHPRGEIWSAILPPGADLAEARFRPFLKADFHMSYPFPIEGDAGERLLTAETWEAGAALLWREEAGGWIGSGVLFDGRPLVDPTLWKSNGRWWLFCTFQDDEPDGRLHLFHAGRLGDPWTAHPRNPIKTGRDGSRPAGPLFRFGDCLIRPAQDCSRTYGGAVILQAVTRLDADGFEEEPLRRIEFADGPYPHGPHTFFPAGSVTLIDAKRWQVDLWRVVRRILRPVQAPSVASPNPREWRFSP